MNLEQLNKFSAKCDIRFYLLKPWLQGEYAVATNGHIAIRVPAKDFVSVVAQGEGGEPRVDVLVDKAKALGLPLISIPELAPPEPCEYCSGTGAAYECEDCSGEGTFEHRGQHGTDHRHGAGPPPGQSAGRRDPARYRRHREGPGRGRAVPPGLLRGASVRAQARRVGAADHFRHRGLGPQGGSVMATKPVVIHVELTDQEALDYAQFLKRVGFSDYRSNAIDHDEAYRMMAVGEKVRKALADAGYAPR